MQSEIPTRDDAKTYAVVQFISKTEEDNPAYIVINTDWIFSNDKGKYVFYWPMGDAMHNKLSVRYCMLPSSSTSSVVKLKAFVRDTDDFYEAVLWCVTLRTFGIDVHSVNNIKQGFEKVSELIHCDECSPELHARATRHSRVIN